MQTAHEIAAAVRDGKAAASDVLDQSLERIRRLDALIEAWMEVAEAPARAQAAVLDQAKGRAQAAGALAGVPVGIKDIVDVAGVMTRAGAGPFAHRMPERDSNVVRRLREAGAVIVGKTHTTQFAYLDPAPTRNPWNRDHTPGGSSSGSGAAVGARMVPMAIGSQTVGSILRPAGYCGIVGLKPTWGRVGVSGVYGLAPSFDHIGLLVTCVRDAALGLSVIAGHDPDDPDSLDAPVEDYVAALAEPRAPALGIPRNYFEATAEPETLAHLAAVAEKLKQAGARITEVQFPATAPEIADAAAPQMRYEAARVHAGMYDANKQHYGPTLADLIERGRATSDAEYEQAKAYVVALRDALSGLLREVDALLLPTAPGPAPAGLNTTGPGIFCGPASFTGLPSISLPSGLASNGLPHAVQLIGPRLGESRLLNVAAWVEGVLGFREQPRLPE